MTYVDGFSHGGGDEVHGLFESVRVAGTRVQNVNAHRDVRKQTRVRVDFLSKERENQTRNEETKDQGKVRNEVWIGNRLGMMRHGGGERSRRSSGSNNTWRRSP